ncbi:MAG: GAF domain-containing protein [Lachnospiraceae bacterium]|nr:GAF domain-containing protein [Lachnospiraceae bacterium]MBQ7863596.1 GAF domain-containing protein [Lachnospiraceae bacterium]
MSETHLDVYPTDKKELYTLLAEQLTALTDGEPHAIPNLANCSALLFYALKDINWAGFYLTQTNETTGKEYLLLGPFQGKTACIRIPTGRGVCGTALATGEVQLVEDVHEFPGHIACDSASNSEIVLPIRKNGDIVGVLDIDSPIVARFDEEDKEGLQKLVEILEKACEF